MPIERLTRAEKRDQTRAALLDAAERIFTDQGFHATSVDQIAEAAGYTKGAVYSNFESKEDLLVAVLDRHTGSMLQSLTAILAAPSDITTKLKLAGSWYDRDPERARNWAMLEFELVLLAARNPELRAVQAERSANFRAGLADALASTAEELALDMSLSPVDLAQAMVAVGDGLLVQRLLEPDARPGHLFSSLLGLLLRQDPATLV